jgi:non-specific serine/threonine protein kinase
LEQLAASGEEDSVRDAHAAYMLSLAEQTNRLLFTPDFQRFLARLNAELDNIRAALAWAESRRAGELNLRLAAAMGPFWIFRGHYREGRNWLERALERADPVPSASRAAGLMRAGWLVSLQGEAEQAESLLIEALNVARGVGDRWSEALALLGMGIVDLQRGAAEQAASWTGQSLPVFQELETSAVAGAQFLSVAYANLGQVALTRGDTAAAAGYLDEALRRQRSLDFSWGLGDTLRILGDLAREQGEHEQALACYREGLELIHAHGDRRFIAEALAGTASLAAERGQGELAARLYGATERLRDQLGVSTMGWDRAAYERAVARARAAMTPEAFAAAWTAGAALPLDAIIVEAVAEAGQEAGGADRGSEARLTPREREILGLLANGLSDRQIAESLSISHRTVGFHITNLLAKLGVKSRTAAAAYAIRHGLA